MNYEGGSSAANFDKIEKKKLLDDIDHLKT